MLLLNKLLNKAFKTSFCRRLYSQKSVAVKKKVDEKDDPALVRNIGILAHIDAGKTTTTERMLFFSGVIDNMGEVHDGNTVTDFMEQERQRGITITSASVTFPWDKHRINLLDTPGHIDFTMEVEQTLNVMDGAVVVLDGCAGVEAQTVTVWRQAERYSIPRIIYVNKLDRPDSGFFQSVNSVEAKLKTIPVVVQVPIFNESRILGGVIDLITMELYNWDPSTLGIQFSKKKLSHTDGKTWENALKGRIRLTETLADLDDNLAEMIISEKEAVETMSEAVIKDSVRKITELRRGVPVLCGSSYKNIGIQLLMDAIVQYLPSPLSNKSSTILQCFKNNLCARAFKVRHDPFKGPVTFLRIYSGSISNGQNIFNMRMGVTEKCHKVMVAYADDYEEVENVSTGNIAAVTGLEVTRVGDLITSSASVMSNAKKLLESSKLVDSQNINEMFAVEAFVPDPVFYCSVEAPSMDKLDRALAELTREDPSLRVSISNETGQTVLAGMGELHLDIIRERIRKDYNVNVETGPLQIAYKEELIEPRKDTHIVYHKIGKRSQDVKIVMSVLHSKKNTKEILLLDRSHASIPNISAIFPKHLVAVKNGVESALANGPKLFCPVVNVQVMLHWLEIGKGTSDSIITSAAAQCVKKLLKSGGTRLLEPVMYVEVVCPDDLMTAVIEDMGGRRAEFQRTDMRGSDKVLQTVVPLAELLGYATHLRILTSGQASFSMEFHSYAAMDPKEEAKAIKSVTGFDPL